MKKPNLLITSILIATSFVFMSCSKSDSSSSSPTTVAAPTLSFTASSTKITGSESAKLYIQITKGDNNIQKLVIKRNDTTLTDASNHIWDGTSNNKGYYNTTNSTVKDSATISFSSSGTYVFTAIAYDSQGNTSTQTITIVRSISPAFSTSTISTETPNKSIYCYQTDQLGLSCYANSNSQTYTPYNAANYDYYIDFIYYNAAGNYNIYAPSAFTNFSSSVASWGKRNATTFAKVTTLNYTTATLAQVTSAANSAKDHEITGLAKGDVIVFKTASTSVGANKIGIFTVNSVTPGKTSTDYINISIRISKAAY